LSDAPTLCARRHYSTTPAGRQSRPPTLAFAKEGATVVAAGRREAEGEALEAELRALGAQAAFIKADVRHEDEVRRLVDETVARFGRLDVAINNAGTEGKPGPSPSRHRTATQRCSTPTCSARC
jgi:NAD(P)-dependent dehydrogenase (short-subunit alcohol dehydrogenase family)